MNFRFHHVCLTVKDINESISWYEDKLGFELFHKYEKYGMEIAQLKRDSIKIELFSFGNKTKQLPKYREQLMDDLHVVGTKHLCLEVESLNETINLLKSKGVKFVMNVDTAGFGGRFIFFKDCNGILIELYQP